MRRLILLVAVAACASMGAPPGGPERKDPPVLLSVTPDSGATNVHVKDATFQFDEVVSEKPAKGELDQVFIVSPRDGAPNVGWHRSRITVRPRHGFQPNTAYTITMTPGMSDVRGNVLKEGAQVVFSTGPTIPKLGIVGHAFDWASETPAVNATIEAVRHPDSTVFITLTDSTGAFDIGPFGPGTYTLRGYLDQNANFQIDRLEKWDSVRVTVGDTRPITELLLIPRDSTPPVMAGVRADDSVTVSITFDRPLLVGPSGVGKFSIVRPDSTPLTIDSVLTEPQYRQRQERLQRAKDSTKAAADTTKKAAVDTTKRAPAVAPPAAAPPPAAAKPGKPPLPKPSVPPPPTGVVLLLSPKTPVLPGVTYRVTAKDVAGLLGTRGTATRQLSVPRPAPRDTTKKSPADTTKRPATTPLRPPLR